MIVAHGFDDCDARPKEGLGDLSTSPLTLPVFTEQVEAIVPGENDPFLGAGTES
jgi:hypothetical protein